MVPSTPGLPTVYVLRLAEEWLLVSVGVLRSPWRARAMSSEASLQALFHLAGRLSPQTHAPQDGGAVWQSRS